MRPVTRLIAPTCAALLWGLACLGERGGSSGTDGVALVPGPGSPFRLGDGLGRPILADLDRDGALDIVVPFDGNPGARGGGVIATLLGDGDGGFREHARRTLVPHGHLKLAAGDLDEDGIVDVAAAAHDSYEVRLFLGDGGGGLRDAGLVEARSGSRPHTHSVALADVDVDGHLDLLTSNADHGDVSVLLGDGGGRFRPAPGSPFAAGRHPYEGMVVEDVDGDGSPDVVVPDLEGASVHVLLGDGSGGFAPAEGSPYAVAVRPGSVAVGDVDGDRLPDVVATHDDDAVVSMLRGVDSGGPAFAPVAGSPFPLEQRAWDARVVDLDGDGRNELVLGGVHRHVLVRSSDPAAWTARATRRVGAGDRGPGYLAVGDLDGDRLLDVVTGNFSGTVSVLLARR